MKVKYMYMESSLKNECSGILYKFCSKKGIQVGFRRIQKPRKENDIIILKVLDHH